MCNSRGVAELIKSQLFSGQSKAVTINKGHDVEWYKGYEPVDIRKKLSIPDNALLLISVGNNRKMKGIPYLLKAMNELPKNSNIHLLLAGRDMDKPENLKLANSGPNPEKIHFMGFQKDVLNLVAACDVFVLASIFGESITKSVIEAMSLGITPIITDIPGNTELVVNEESGLVVKSRNPVAIKDAVLKLYNDRQMCVEMGENARMRIANHLNYRHTILKVREMYEDLVATTRN
jgi:glycosyltransferase involved in cell wall biosynthesis